MQYFSQHDKPCTLLSLLRLLLDSPSQWNEASQRSDLYKDGRYYH